MIRLILGIYVIGLLISIFILVPFFKERKKIFLTDIYHFWNTQYIERIIDPNNYNYFDNKRLIIFGIKLSWIWPLVLLYYFLKYFILHVMIRFPASIFEYFENLFRIKNDLNKDAEK